MIKVKICGITNRDDAACAVDNGADAIGFIFYSLSPRYIDPQKVGEIVGKLPPFVVPVGVFVNAPREQVTSIIDKSGIRVIQFHGDEEPKDCQGYSLPVIRALRVGLQFRMAELEVYPLDTFLLDSSVDGHYGGTGEVFNWALVRDAAASVRIILSGGINSENVIEAIRTTRPYGVDCGSGVESKPGRKDPVRLAKFLRIVRSMGEF